MQSLHWSLRVKGTEQRSLSALYSTWCLVLGSLSAECDGGVAPAESREDTRSKFACIVASSRMENPCFVLTSTLHPCWMSVAICSGLFQALRIGGIPSLSARSRSAPVRAKWVKVGRVPRFHGSQAARKTGE